MRIPALTKSLLVKAAALITVTAGIVAVVVQPAGADAVAQSTVGVLVQGPGTLGSHGAVVTVPVVTVCDPYAQSGNLYVEVTQRAGSEIAHGTEYLMVSCTGTLQNISITINAEGRPFKPGVAFVSAQLGTYVFGTPGYQTATDEREIRFGH